MQLRFILTVICINFSNSFVPINPSSFSRNLRLYEEVEEKKGISGIVDLQRQKLSIKTRKIIDQYDEIFSNFQKIPGKISQNYKSISDSIVYFPSNVTANVDLTISTLQVYMLSLHVYECIYLHIYACVHAYICMYMHTCIFMFIYICIYIYIYIYLHMNKYIYIYIYTDIYTYMYAYN
jgi:hypothetical protein